MLLFWLVLWVLLPDLVFLSGFDRCTPSDSSSSQNVSPLLESLQCYNDYQSYVHCIWREGPHKRSPLQLWFKNGTGQSLCQPYGSPLPDTDEYWTVQCRYEPSAFAIGIKHTAFFKNGTLSVCSSVPHKHVQLSEHLTVLPPVNLSTHDAPDGGQLLQWSSSYASPSSVNRKLTYQISYRAQKQGSWTTVDAMSTHVTLEKERLVAGCRYKARVRARAHVGHWSSWSPVVTWKTAEHPEQFPSLDCVLHGEKGVKCGWEVSKELADFITYQLHCRNNQTAVSQSCCIEPTVTADHREAVLRYSCFLTNADPEHMLLELRPKYSAKTFKAHQHIRPARPQQVEVKEKDGNWFVMWKEPNITSTLDLYYQVCYYPKEQQDCSVPVNISEGSRSLNILGASLASSQHYQVKVRSLVVPGSGPEMKGIPSEWTDPVDWTSHAAVWSFSTYLYIVISVVAAVLSLTLYCIIPTCQRRVILWVDSIPSPRKSKTLHEIKSTKSLMTRMQREVQDVDSLSTCYSDVSFWSTKDTEKEHLQQEEDCWNYKNLSPNCETGKSSEMSSVSFSGPYIFCQPQQPHKDAVDVQQEEKDEGTKLDSTVPPTLSQFTLYGGGYVCLPNPAIARSTEELVPQSNGSKNEKQDLQDATQDNQLDPKEPASSNPILVHTNGPFTAWPQEDVTLHSGYWVLP
ncbi:cytokine receptor common subunit beta [Thalassophryne amazonica]|uniref:cytokine receptor common subunit beta n=1 Tax=Thalassophryne amazonica TaxID=390379 RepID=UPI0014715ED1|nr:cytokine receptor common subunit beta [Thalassophryne amazonica]